MAQKTKTQPKQNKRSQSALNFNSVKSQSATQSKVKIEQTLETKWRCWRCKNVVKMGDPCLKCNKYLQDYPYDDFQALLMCVKKHAVKPSFDRTSLDGRLDRSAASL